MTSLPRKPPLELRETNLAVAAPNDDDKANREAAPDAAKAENYCTARHKNGG